VPVRVRV
jgi:hypothetical protein